MQSSFTEWEDAVVKLACEHYGGKWAAIARLLSGRTDNAVKNRYNCTIKRKENIGEFSNAFISAGWSLDQLVNAGESAPVPSVSSQTVDHEPASPTGSVVGSGGTSSYSMSQESSAADAATPVSEKKIPAGSLPLLVDEASLDIPDLESEAETHDLGYDFEPIISDYVDVWLSPEPAVCDISCHMDPSKSTTVSPFYLNPEPLSPTDSNSSSVFTYMKYEEHDEARIGNGSFLSMVESTVGAASVCLPTVSYEYASSAFSPLLQ